MPSQLFASYKGCLCNYYRSRCIDTERSSVRKQHLPTFNCDAAMRFQSCFDNICRHLFFNCFSDFNDYSTPILSTSDFLSYLNASKNIFPEQWAFVSSHCNINYDRDCNALTEFKERQVFISLLILQRMTNFRCLPHWCLIISTAMYGWGTRDTVSHATSFLGTTVSQSFWDRFYTLLMVDIVENVIKLLSREISCLMVLDIFQRSNQLRDQRGGSSNKFLIGTSEAAHRVIPFLNFS